jgi:hypothetical protein
MGPWPVATWRTDVTLIHEILWRRVISLNFTFGFMNSIMHIWRTPLQIIRIRRSLCN